MNLSRLNIQLTLLSVFSAVFFGCRPRNHQISDVKLYGGIEDEKKNPAVVVLVSTSIVDYGGKERALSEVCTGTFVGKRTLITAAHCIPGARDNMKGDEEVNVANWGSDVKLEWSRSLKDYRPEAKAKRIFISSRYHTSGSVFFIYDMAIVEFDGGDTPAITPVSFDLPKVGTKAEMSGYGANDDSRLGPKRHGTTTIKEVTPEKVITTDGREFGKKDYPDGYRPGIEQGDSGGPLLVDGKVVGVVSGGIYGYASAAQQQNSQMLKNAARAGFDITGLSEIISPAGSTDAGNCIQQIDWAGSTIPKFGSLLIGDSREDTTKLCMGPSECETRLRSVRSGMICSCAIGPNGEYGYWGIYRTSDGSPVEKGQQKTKQLEYSESTDDCLKRLNQL